MGRQINFYMLKEDERKFLSFTSESASVGFIPKWFETGTLKSHICDMDDVLNSSFESNDDAPMSALSWCIWNRDVTPLQRIVIKPWPARSARLVDIFKSEVVSLSRSRLVDGVLRRGRIWTETEERSEEYLQWFASLQRWVRRHCERYDDLNWVGPAAMEWVNGGGTLGPP